MKNEIIKRTVINDETGEVKDFSTDQEFLEYAQEVYHKNEDNNPYVPSTIHWLPEDTQQAAEYIHEYCGNLELTEYGN